MYPKNPLLQKCFTYLKSLPNIEPTIREEPYFSSKVLADGELVINTPNGTAKNYIYEIKSGITNDGVDEITNYFAKLGERLDSHQKPLLITRNLSSLVIDKLLKRNIEFIDVDGNIYLNRPGIYIVVRNQALKDSLNKSLEITAATLQVMYALLYQPKLIFIENDFEEKIADISDVTSKTVKSTLRKLEELNYIRRIRGGYEISDYIKLLERWELGYFERLRTKLLVGTYSPNANRSFSEVEANLKGYSEECGYLIGGELGASIINKYLRPINATLHLKKDVNQFQIVVKLKLKPDPNGNIIVLKNFGDDESKKGKFGLLTNNIVHPLLIHAELVWNGNSRLKETAKLIYDKYIEDIAQKND